LAQTLGIVRQRMNLDQMLAAAIFAVMLVVFFAVALNAI
jgi:hypothetical protein